MRILVTGATGQLGAYLVDELLKQGRFEVTPWGRTGRTCPPDWPIQSIELTDKAAVVKALDQVYPEVILHTAAISSAEAVRRDLPAAWAVNVEATQTLAAWCRLHQRRLLLTSTDMVFDGERGWYTEEDPPAPILAYGATKAAAEAIVRDLPGGLVARLSLLYGPSRSHRLSFYDRCMAELQAGHPQVFFEDEFRTPMPYATAARALIELASSGATGIVHVAGRERLSRYELMIRAAATLGMNTRLISGNRQSDVELAEPRPADVSLRTSRLETLLPGLHRPGVEDALQSP